MTQKVNNGVRKVFRNLKAFSLVELIIVIAIVAILSVAGFLTLQKWISESRDSKRLGDLETIEKSLTVNYADSSTSELYPTPDNAEEITGDDGETTWYQGYFGSGAVEEVSSLSKVPQDPLWTGYEYSVTADQSAFEVYAELENEKKLSYINRVYADEEGTIVKRGNYEGYLMSTSGSNYNLYNPPSIYMYSGSSLASGEANYVYQEGEAADSSVTVTGVDITDLKDDEISNDDPVYDKVKNKFGLETVEEAETVVKKAKGGKKIAEDVDNTSCKTLLESGKTESGTYEIDPDGDGNGFEVYCDMETEGGGRTLIMVGKGGNTDGRNTTSSLNNPTYSNTFKLSDKKINSVSGRYRVSMYKDGFLTHYRTKYVSEDCNYGHNKGTKNDPCGTSYSDYSLTSGKVVEDGDGRYGISSRKAYEDNRIAYTNTDYGVWKCHRVVNSSNLGTSTDCSIRVWKR